MWLLCRCLHTCVQIGHEHTNTPPPNTHSPPSPHSRVWVGGEEEGQHSDALLVLAHACAKGARAHTHLDAEVPHAAPRLTLAPPLRPTHALTPTLTHSYPLLHTHAHPRTSLAHSLNAHLDAEAPTKHPGSHYCTLSVPHTHSPPLLHTNTHSYPLLHSLAHSHAPSHTPCTLISRSPQCRRPHTAPRLTLAPPLRPTHALTTTLTHSHPLSHTLAHLLHTHLDAEAPTQHPDSHYCTLSVPHMHSPPPSHALAHSCTPLARPLHTHLDSEAPAQHPGSHYCTL